jgi:hypothetical protein
MSKRLRVKYALFLCRILMKFYFFGEIFEKSSCIRFNQNPSCGNRVVPCGQTDMTKPIVVFRGFANAPKMRDERLEKCSVPCSFFFV